MEIIRTEMPNLCFVGDIHGDFHAIPIMMKFSGMTDTAYVFCGDCGFGFESQEHYKQVFNKVARTANKLNTECYFVRGNHESKEYYDNHLIDRKRFKTVKDYTVIQTPTRNILCVGGATSIDRNVRKPTNEKYLKDYFKWHPNVTMEEAQRLAKKVYWEDEAPIYDESAMDELRDSGIKIDVVATHTCPSFAKPIGKENLRYWLRIDPKLEEDIDAERQVMDKVYERLLSDGHPLIEWFYGHFHYHNSEYIGGVHFTMLDMAHSTLFDVVELRS